jgi:hypothetical protein
MVLIGRISGGQLFFLRRTTAFDNDAEERGKSGLRSGSSPGSDSGSDSPSLSRERGEKQRDYDPAIVIIIITTLPQQIIHIRSFDTATAPGGADCLLRSCK